jgi:hypothetical protein
MRRYGSRINTNKDADRIRTPTYACQAVAPTGWRVVHLEIHIGDGILHYSTRSDHWLQAPHAVRTPVRVLNLEFF